MILEKQTEATILSEGQSQDSTKMSLDLDSAQILMQMLSKNLYSDAVGSTIREWASNALDSHRKAGVDKPTVVSFIRNSNDNYEFSVEDFGTGLDNNDVVNIISKYGKSIKRDSNEFLGAMGLGFKSGLAYSSSFYFVARKDGMERKYMMYEGEEVNTIDLLYEKPTTEGNGVKMILPVQYNDKYEFIRKMREQLAYFEGVYFNVHNDEIKNDFTIYRGEHFQSSTLCNNKELHLCLDNVYYPIDFQKLGIDKINIPIGLKFGLNDGIFPIPNRESIKYSKETKEAILNKIKLVADILVTKYNTTIHDTDDFKAIIEYYNTFNKMVDGFVPGTSFDICTIIPHASVSVSTPKLNGVKLLDLNDVVSNRSYILNEYTKKYEIRNGTFRENKKSWNTELNINHLRYNDVIYCFSNRINGVMKDYLKSIHFHNVIFVKKDNPFILGRIGRNTDYNTYIKLCSLTTKNKSEWRERIKEYQYIQSLFTQTFIDLDSLVISQKWLDDRKAFKNASKVKVGGNGTRRVKLEGEVSVKKAEKLERYVTGKNCKFVPDIIKLAEFHRNKTVCIYGGGDDVELMDKLFITVKNAEFFQLSERELKRIQDAKLHNLIPLSTFMKGEHKIFKRVVTAYLIQLLINKYQHVFKKKDRLKAVSKDLYDKLVELENYKNRAAINYADNATLKAMCDVAKEHNLFDISIKSLHDETVKTLERLPFLNPLFSEISNYCNYKENDEDALSQTICSLFKYYKQKVNWDKYKKIIINDEVFEEEITEEVMEDLMDD